MNELFFELIRVAVGTAEELSRMPSSKEWKQLYEMAKKQSLIGVCFAGLQRLGADADEGFAQIGMSEMQYLTWMGMAAQIHQKNETVNRQCVALQKQLSDEGIGSCLLKGQGVGQLYAEHLRGLRQSGDIDALVDCGRKKALAFVQKVAPTNEVNHKHVQLHCFEDTEVELHYIAAELHCPWHNKQLQRFFTSHNHKEKITIEEAGDIDVPNISFNLVHLLTHTYRHLFGDGIGLRQVMDLYFTLCKYHNESISETKKIKKVIHNAGMERFASAMMWVQNHVFGLNMTDAPWEPNQEDGKFLLDEIMIAGNFGKYDPRINRNGESRAKRFFRVTKQNMRLLRFSPMEVICTPIWRIWHFCWMRSHGFTQG